MPSTRHATRSHSLLAVVAAVISLVTAFALSVAVPTAISAAEAPTITSDKADYPPGATVTLTGEHWQPGETVHIVVNDTIGKSWKHEVDVVADEDGVITNVFQISAMYVSDYDVTATGLSGVATTTFTDAAGDIDQCANDAAPSPSSDGCTATGDWINGNLGSNKANYLEGDFVPYRIKMSGLALGAHSVTIEWDTTKGGKHALDYIGTFKQTVATANPCAGVTGCNLGTFSTFPIPVDAQVSGGGVTQVPGVFTLFGGTITSVSAYSYPTGAGFTGDKSAQITINFTASTATPVFAWAGHIASRTDWGNGNSAVAISGSPYHSRIIGVDGDGGNQDLSLSSDAVVFPASIKVVKQANPEGSTSFPFTAGASPLSNFALVDDGTSTDTKLFSNITDFKTYTVTEVIPSGWALTSLACSVTSANGGSQGVNLGTATASINLKEGEDVTCTYGNLRQAANLTVIKHVINDDGGTSVASDFTMTINDVTAVGGNEFPGAESPGTTKELSTVGPYDVTESGPSGYSATYSADCSGTIAFGQSKTCTITNNDQPAHLKLVKTVTNNSGGAAVATDFVLSADGPTPISGAGGAESDVDAGTYDLSETGVAGYTAGDWSCVGGDQSGDSVTLGVGESATCTINNNDQSAHLKLVKTVTNDNGGTAEITDFVLAADGPTPIFGAGGTESDVDAGTYDLSETTLPGYTAGGWSCVGGDQSGDSVTLGVGESATCTINNNDQSAHLKLVKTVTNDNGGTAEITDFVLSADGPTSISGAGGTESDVDTGTYTLSETTLAGYAEGTWSCVGGDQNGIEVTLALGESATCTINNNDQTAHLKLVKTVTNDNGGTAEITDFVLSADGPTPISGNGGAESDVNPGTYDLSETTLPGYTAGDWSCVGGDQNEASVTLALGESATCTINNNDQTAHLKLVKTVTNDNGGTAQVTDFVLSADGPTPISGNGGAESDVNPGTYDLSETSVAGYTAGDWSCVGGDQNEASVTLALGESATCTINNNDQTAHLKLVKTVTNDDGGTAVETDFVLSADGPTPISGSGGVESDVDAGTYDLSETTLPGYTAGEWDCAGGLQDEDSITLALGESATCTIVNEDDAAHLKLVKTVTNDDGGTAVETDFVLSAAGPTPISGAGGAESDVDAGTYDLFETTLPGYLDGPWNCDGGDQDGDSVTLALGESATCTINNDDIPASLTLVKTVTNDHGGTAQTTDFVLSADGPTPISGAGGTTSFVDAGTYDLSETTLPGYTPGAWSCVGGDQDGDSVTLALGESATCTIDNNDQPAHLKLVKVVTNDDGGEAVETDFVLSADGPTPISGAGGTESDVSAGTYTLSESDVDGYVAGDWDCDGGNQDGASVTLALGESATCTITNNDAAASLTLVKTVTNDDGGTAVTTDFILSADGPTPISGAGGVSDAVDAGTYDLSETNLPGYTAGAWSCVGGDQDGASVTLALGESATCTINNNDQTAHLKLVKTVTNDDGGTAATTDFTLSAAGADDGPVVLSGAGGAESDVDAGTYDLSETNLPGYTAGAWSCVGGDQDGDSIELALGESATCTINNNDDAAHLTLVKTVVNDDGGEAVEQDFVLSADGPTPISGPGGASSAVDAGTYDLSETTMDGYTAGDWSCVGGDQDGDSVELALGESATCTIINNDIPAHLKLVKVVVNDNGGTAVETDFTLTADGPELLFGAGGAESDVDAGTYDLSESPVAGYTPSAWDCDGGTQAGAEITVPNGGSATCTITNNDDPAHLKLVKTVTNDNGGTAVANQFTLSAEGADDGPVVLSGAGGAESDVSAGTYDLSETNLPGYTPGAWSCTGGSQEGASITLGIGQNATCTINNNDQPAHLKLVKTVTNDHGGTAVPTDFTLSATKGAAVISGAGGTESDVNAGEYTLSETTLPTYTAGAWSCVSGSQNGSKVTLTVGQSATCTINNDDKPGTIVIKKVTKPANTGSFGFTTTGTGYNPFTIGGGQQNSQSLAAGSYTVTETAQNGWALTGIGGSTNPETPYACVVTGTGGSSGLGNLATGTTSITLKNGDTVTCTYENTANGTTRTQGFWSAHPELAQAAWFGGSVAGHTFPGVAATAGIGDRTLCNPVKKDIDSLAKLMGGFHSGIPKTTTGAKRASIDQSRMQLLQQMLAAELNASAFGSTPAGGVGQFAAWEAAYCGNNEKAIKTAQSQAAAFNEGGDSGTFTPGMAANPKAAKAVADLVYWNVLP